MQSSAQHTAVQKNAFTVIELLVAMAIIAVLLTLSVQATQVFIVQAERNSTRATIRKINGLLRDRIEAFDRAYTGDTRRRFIRDTAAILRNGIPAPPPGALDDLLKTAERTPDSASSALRVLARKTGFRYFFPQKMSDLTDFEASTQMPPEDLNKNGILDLGEDDNNNGILDIGVSDTLYSRLLAPVARQQLIKSGTASPTAAQILGQAKSNWANHDRTTESAELLYYFLLRSTDFGSSSVGSDQFSSSEVADTDGDGLPEFVDRWGQPLRFYRWPTRLVRRGGTNYVPTPAERQVAGFVLKSLPPPPFVTDEPNLALRDPEDPVGLLDSLVAQYVGAGVGSVINETNYHTLETFHSPLVVSAGADQELGMNEPWDTASFGHLANRIDDDEEFIYDNVVSGSGTIGGAQ